MKLKKWVLPLVLAVAAVHGQQILYTQQGAPWYQDISSAALDTQSSAVINWLQGMGGWGTGNMQIDFSINVLMADQTTPFKTFTPTSDFYVPDCDLAQMPVPAAGALEGETGYQCVSDGDCHLLVWYAPTRTLYEMWRANIVNQTFDGGCLAIWDMNQPYNPLGRGEQCTSADAAGLPIAPLLFSADEVSAGQINHAIRFILPNARIRHSTYVHPATHATGTASGGASAPPYGTRLRLRADFPLDSLPNNGARTVARAMQHYGMFLADGGNIALTAQNDSFTTAKWSGQLSSHDLFKLKVTDFQMVAGGTRYTFTGDCVRTAAVINDPAVKRQSAPSIICTLKNGTLFVAAIGEGQLTKAASMEIFDVQGKIAGRLQIAIPGSVAFNAHNGCYFIKIKTEGRSFIQKIFVMSMQVLAE